MSSGAVVWQSSHCSFEIEFSPVKLDEIRIAVVEGFYSVPRGGVEVGGVLFGRPEGKRMVVESFRMMECEHLAGPSFQLSNKDKAALQQMLAAAAPAEPVGFFVSHTRSEIFLAAQEIELFEKYFPKPSHFAVVFKPVNLKPTRAAYFFRDAAGTLPTEKSCAELVVEPMAPEPRVKASPLPTPPRPAPVPVAAPTLPPKAPPAIPRSEERPLFTAFGNGEPLPRKKPKVPWVGISAALAAIGLGSAAYVTREVWNPKPPEPLRLRASEADGKLLLRWNAPQDNASGTLEISDGDKKVNLPLNSDQASRGFYLYARQSPKIAAHLKLGSREDSTAFVGPVFTNSQALAEEMEKTKQEEQKVKDDLHQQTSPNQEPQKKAQQLTRKAEQKKRR